MGMRPTTIRGLRSDENDCNGNDVRDSLNAFGPRWVADCVLVMFRQYNLFRPEYLQLRGLVQVSERGLDHYEC